MFKKGISLTVLTITVTILIILTASVILTSMDFKGKTEYIKFDKNIKLIEKTIRKEYIRGNIIGTLLEDYEENTDNVQDNFNFEPTELEDLIEAITERYTNIDIEHEKQDYYLLNREDLIELGLNEIYDEYLVNYKKGFVFSIKPIQKDNEYIYTTQFIDNIMLKKLSGQTVTIDDMYSKGIYNYKIYGNSVQRNLPEGYTQLEYIESTGTQYIDTGIIGKSSTNIEVDVMLNTNSTERIFGARTSLYKYEMYVAANGSTHYRSKKILF